MDSSRQSLEGFAGCSIVSMSDGNARMAEEIRNNRTIQVPYGARRVLELLHEAGYEAYVVGGCVRDSLLGRTPEDWDITTSALPAQVKEIFHRTIDTGIRHGTVTVRMQGGSYEVTTYRVDGDYKDARHPSSVTFTRSLLEDLKRRDFTINAMAYSDETGIIDAFNGLEDLEKRVIRAVGNPQERFTEDALRMMRALRFAAQLDYTIEPATEAAIAALAVNLRKISAERIRTELEKLLLSDHPEELRRMYELGITAQILPEFDACMQCPQNNRHHQYNVGEHLIHAVCAVRSDRVLRLTMLLHDIGKPLCRTTDPDGVDHFHGHVEKSAAMAEKILRRLKYDNDTTGMVVRLVASHDLGIGMTPEDVRKAMAQVGSSAFPLLLEVKTADCLAQSSFQREEKLARIRTWRRLYEDIIARKDPLELKDLAVNGKDLIGAGIQPGREVGRILHEMLAEVLVHPEHNKQDWLLSHYAPGKPGKR